VKLPIGRRDALLLELREKLFGAELVGVVNCPECGERLQVSQNAVDLQSASDDATDVETVRIDDYTVHFSCARQ